MSFIVRAWPVQSNAPPQDRDGGDDLAAAIDRARELAGLREYRPVMVTDGRATVWAEFNMLWAWGRAAGQ